MREQNRRPGRVGVRGVGIVLIAAMVMSGCVTVQRADGSPETLREAIRAGELVKPGDRVTLITPSMGERTMRVTEVDDDFIRGDNTEVPIDEIVALEKRHVDARKTLAVVAGGYLGLYLLAGLAFLVAVGDI